jgi:hypothetical protein
MVFGQTHGVPTRSRQTEIPPQHLPPPQVVHGDRRALVSRQGEAQGEVTPPPSSMQRGFCQSVGQTNLLSVPSWHALGTDRLGS